MVSQHFAPTIRFFAEVLGQEDSFMQSVTVKSHIGPDGVLNLQIPLGLPETDVEVVVVVQPLAPDATREGSTSLGWPPNYFEETFGSFRDHPLVRGDQGAYEVWDELT